jgi:para-nitrobenzyl esterase
MFRRALLCSLAVACSDEDPLRVELDTGVIQGSDLGEVRAWYGVPYAAPPVDDLRWRAPQRIAAWDGVRDAYMIGSQCPQSFSISGAGGLEDCLFVNVWSPESASKAPVMVWLHGGGFSFGSGGDSYYAGEHLAETYGVIVVTVNYRLGALGFMAHPGLRAEDPAYPSSGNYGIDDQIAALEWVQRNIAAFGGDRTRVTVFGESAGGFSACALYVSPRTTGLFHAAISQSGLCSMAIPERTQAEADAAGAALAQAVGCPATGAAALACLRGKSPEQVNGQVDIPPIADQLPGGPLYAGGAFNETWPSVDSFVHRATLREASAAGGFEPRPLILGSNRDEGTLFHTAFYVKEIANEAEYRAALSRRFGATSVDAIATRYPVASFSSANRALAEVSGDAFFVCPSRRAARGAAAVGAPVYLYSFERPPQEAFTADLGVFHSIELPFVFGTDPKFPLGTVGESGRPVAEAMQGYWTRFAATGDPSEGGDPIEWPRYDGSGDRLLAIDAASAVRAGHKAALCDFWDALVVP